MKRFLNRYSVITGSILSLLVIASCTPHSEPTKSEGQDLASYGNMCSEVIRDLPSFSCSTGTMVPITVNGGETPGSYYPNMDCDRPSLLPLGPDSDGQCIAYSRVLDLSEGDAQVAALCQQKNIRTPSSLLFDETDIASHSAKNGNTH